MFPFMARQRINGVQLGSRLTHFLDQIGGSRVSAVTVLNFYSVVVK